MAIHSPLTNKNSKKYVVISFFFLFFFHFCFVFAYNKNKSVYPSVFCDNSDLEILNTSCGKGEPIWSFMKGETNIIGGQEYFSKGILESQRTKNSFFYGEKKGRLDTRLCPLQVHDFHNISLFPNNLSLNSLCSS